eukprot:2927073-Alexandrium_andersonii.AAC.1
MPVSSDWSVSARLEIPLHAAGTPGLREATRSPRASPRRRRARTAVGSRTRSALSRHHNGRACPCTEACSSRGLNERH